MDITLGRQPFGPSTAHPAESSARTAADRAKLAQLAQEFEASLLVQMVRQMRQSLLSEEEEGLGNSTMTDTLDVELARQLAAQGGIGLGRVLEQGMDKLAGVDLSTQRYQTSTLSGQKVTQKGQQVGPKSALETVAETPGLVLPLTESVNSAYGWRDDPFHGARKFHAGLDFRAAYGREVPSAGAGRVVFAGERGAYGQMVVVDHGGGVETRYAHLSGVTVAVGQELAQGEVVGRVGQTGRATGPHLHFEVLMDGHRVDPMQVAGRLPSGLKNVTADDD